MAMMIMIMMMVNGASRCEKRYLLFFYADLVLLRQTKLKLVNDTGGMAV